MTTKYKGIYIMIANKELVGKDQYSQLAGQGLQQLVNSNVIFKMLWIQARTEGPKFYEGTQQIQQQNQPFEVIVANFEVWLKKQGVTVEKSRWDSYFFHTTTPDPKAPGWKRYFLVYYHSAGADVMDYPRFMVDHTMAIKDGDPAKLKQLFQAAVSCPACEKVIDPALRANKKGFLACPFCGQWWTKPLKEK